MNFEVFPEIKWSWGYYYFWGVCLALFVACAVLLIWARVIKWPVWLRAARRRAGLGLADCFGGGGSGGRGRGGGKKKRKGE